jgi:hypothetical protein
MKANAAFFNQTLRFLAALTILLLSSVCCALLLWNDRILPVRFTSGSISQRTACTKRSPKGFFRESKAHSRQQQKRIDSSGAELVYS